MNPEEVRHLLSLEMDELIKLLLERRAADEAWSWTVFGDNEVGQVNGVLSNGDEELGFVFDPRLLLEKLGLEAPEEIEIKLEVTLGGHLLSADVVAGFLIEVERQRSRS